MPVVGVEVKLLKLVIIVLEMDYEYKSGLQILATELKNSNGFVSSLYIIGLFFYTKNQAHRGVTYILVLLVLNFGMKKKH